MSKVVKLHSIPENLAEEERLRVLAQRALEPPDLPFDGLHIEAAMILNQLGLAGKIPRETIGGLGNPIDYGGEAS